ncbi:MAG: DNA polymerase III subunit epsilon [Methyloligella sp.]|nr:MAG: DNA polymerase III subunit epsilon [Methyloligella sp.]
MREIVLDTETTGFNADGDDKIIEIGCVELINYIPSGENYHIYINPKRDVPIEAQNVHGITTEFLKDKPLFREVADGFLEFIQEDTLIIHNASFDVGFLNAELKRVRRPIIEMNRVLDTLALARRKYPAGPNSLDALCRRYNIDNSNRTYHGALLDSELLAEVYLELSGQKQAKLELANDKKSNDDQFASEGSNKIRARENQLPSRLTTEEDTAHQEFLNSFKTEPLWNKYS